MKPIALSNQRLGIIAGTLLCVASVPQLLGADKLLSLDDFDWSVGEVRSAEVILREIPVCQGVTDGVDVEFRPTHGALSLVTLHLKARKAGTIDLVPELFLARDGGRYGVYRVCEGMRVVQPEPSPKSAAFHPPANGRQWPGHAGFIVVQRGQSVILELAFPELVARETELLAAAPRKRVRGAGL